MLQRLLAPETGATGDSAVAEEALNTIVTRCTVTQIDTERAVIHVCFTDGARETAPASAPVTTAGTAVHFTNGAVLTRLNTTRRCIVRTVVASVTRVAQTEPAAGVYLLGTKPVSKQSKYTSSMLPSSHLLRKALKS